MNRALIVSRRIIASVVAGIFSFARFFTDSISATDELEKSVGKSVSDSATASDTFTRVVEYNRDFTDSAGTSDALAKASGKAISDSISATDILAKNVSRPVSDTATAGDSGVVLNQDYVDGFYFADDYVGTKRVF